MDRFLKKDLGCRSLVIGTQMGYSTGPIQARLDVVDVHGYWQHPHFPGKPWDAVNWTVRNVSMAAARPAHPARHGGGPGRRQALSLHRVQPPRAEHLLAETYLLLAAYAPTRIGTGSLPSPTATGSTNGTAAAFPTSSTSTSTH